MLAVTREEITDGPLPRALVVLAVPLVAQYLVHVANQVIDVFWLGRLSEAAVAGVGLVIPLLGVALALAFLGHVGTQVVVSQRAGGADLPGARRAAGNGVVLSLALGLFVGAVAAALAPALVGALDPGSTVARFAVPYLTVYALGLPVLFAVDGIEAGFVGVGAARTAFALNAVAVALNIVLDPVFIFGLGPVPAMGVRGAALATVVGHGVGMVFGLAVGLAGRQGPVYTREALRPDRATLLEIVDVGWPNAGQVLGQQGARVVVIWIVAVVAGPAGLAAYTVGARIATLALSLALGLQQATQSVVGQNLGAGAPDRARRATWLGVALATGSLTLVAAGQWLAPLALSNLFVPGASAATRTLTVDYLRILAYGYPALGATYLLYAGFNGARRARTSMVSTLLAYWGVRVPLAAGGALVAGFGVHAVFWAVTLSNVASAVGVGVYYRSEAAGGMLRRAVPAAVEQGSSDRD